MMYAADAEFVKDFARRTLHNYQLTEPNTPYEVTLLINSSIGLLIIPKEHLFTSITNDFISEKTYKKLLACITDNSYIKPLDLVELIRHLRNAIAHGRIDFHAEKQPSNNTSLIIKSAIFSDSCAENKKRGKPEENFKIVIPIDLLREFMLEFARAVSSISPTKD